MVGQDLTGRTVLDCFGGTGLLAAEAWSRGAEVTVVDRKRKQALAIRQACVALGASWRVLHGDCRVLAAKLGTYDLVLADPPYAMVSNALIEAIAPCVGGVLVLEASKTIELADSLVGCTRFRRKQYGNTSVHLYER